MIEKETWKKVLSISIKKSIVIYTTEMIQGHNYNWILFVYAPSPRDFMKLVKEFELTTTGIIEFKTEVFERFKNHSVCQVPGIYRWKRIYHNIGEENEQQ